MIQLYCSFAKLCCVIFPQEEDMKPVYNLPPPQSIKMETGIVDSDVRVPSPLPPDEEEATLDEIYEVLQLASSDV